MSTLRVLADCLDTNLSEVNVLYLPDPTHFTFSDSRDRAEQKYAFPPNQPRHLKDGKKRLLVHIPEGECLRELVGRIQALSGEVDNLAAQLRDEGIDIKDISRPLS